jgi:hypothetical protein
VKGFFIRRDVDLGVRCLSAHIEQIGGAGWHFEALPGRMEILGLNLNATNTW